MTAWQDLVKYVRANYKIADETPTSIKLIFDTGHLRSQVVMLWYETLGDGAEEWLQIESPFAEVDKIDIRKALTEIGRTICGGLAVIGDVLTIRHAVPLANLNINEFERPLALVTNTADRLEAQLAGGDQF
jgi:hypothetical protein